MQETLNAIFDEVRRSWPFRWQGLFIASIAAAAATFIIILLPDVYAVDTRIAVEPEGDSIALQIHNAEVRFLNDPTLDRILEKVDFGVNLKNATARLRAREALQSRITTQGVDTKVFVIRYSDSNAARARDVSELLLAAFKDAVVAGDTGGGAVKDQLSTQQTALSAAEKQVQDYRRAHLDVFAQGGIEARLDGAKATLDKADSDFEAAVLRRDRLQALWRANAANRSQIMQAATIPPGVDPLIDQLYTAFTNLENLRARFSESHPDVILARRDVEIIVRQYPPNVRMCSRDGHAGPQPSAGADSTADSLALDRGTIAVVAANIAVCRAEAILITAEADVRNLSEISVTAFPIQQELKRLTQVRDALQVRVDDLQRRLQAGLDISTLNMYSVIDAPKLPTAPVSPNRRLWLLAALVGTITGGSLVAYLRGLVANTFVRPGEVERAFRIPFYGAVSQIDGLRARFDKSAHALSFSFALGALVATMLVLILADPYISAARQWVLGTVNSIVHTSESPK
jgi:capsular polysaccharide biosynthesis protein